MPAEFIASGSLVLQGSGHFVIHGTIKSGLVRKGMVVNQRNTGLRLTIDAVEFIDRLQNRQSEVTLCIKYAGEDKLASLQRMKFTGEHLRIDDGAV